MNWIAADTHATVWFLEDDKRMTRTARDAMDNAERVLIPSICLVEMSYLIEKGRILAGCLPRLLAELEHPSTNLMLAPLDLGVVLSLADISRVEVPDMPDRIIAATALHHRIPLVTRDGKIRTADVTTIW
jgi:PIN domain nuclease of toxin-antitoxin system